MDYGPMDYGLWGPGLTETLRSLEGIDYGDRGAMLTRPAVKQREWKDGGGSQR
jgi:hypothetical protein